MITPSIHSRAEARFARTSSSPEPLQSTAGLRGWGRDVRDALIVVAVLYVALRLLGVV
jgi:hypothetical protein